MHECICMYIHKPGACQRAHRFSQTLHGEIQWGPVRMSPMGVGHVTHVNTSRDTHAGGASHW